MGRYYIEECKCGVAPGGVACGPVEGSVNASVKVTFDDKTKWITNSEFAGLPSFYMTDESIYERFIENDMSAEFAEYLEDKFISEFENIKLLGDYDVIVKSLAENENNPAVNLIRFIIVLTRCDINEVNSFVTLGTGRYIDEVDFPMSDVEEQQEGW